MFSVFVWTLMISWHFLCSFVFSWLKYFLGRKTTILQPARLWLKLRCFFPQHCVSLCGAVGYSEQGIAFSFRESLAWKPRTNQVACPGSDTGSGGKIHDAYYQPTLETDVLHSWLWSCKEVTSEMHVVKAFMLNHIMHFAYICVNINSSNFYDGWVKNICLLYPSAT